MLRFGWGLPCVALGIIGIPLSLLECAKGETGSGFPPAPDAAENDVVLLPLIDGSTQFADDAPSIVIQEASQDEPDVGLEDGGCDGDVCLGPPVPVCGDGVVNGTEQCDDGNTAPGDGCSASCRLEPGFACVTQTTVPQSACHKTTCGDGKKEGFEQCDDGNLRPYDGCSPSCTVEAKCNGMGGCTGVCGDGLVIPPEQCDDGNTISGDGCSSTCTLEGNGYQCTNADQPPAATLSIPILYRDMLYKGTTALPTPAPTGGGHPDFQNDAYNTGGQKALVVSPLVADGEPSLLSVGNPQVLTNATDFCWWYHDTGCGGVATATNPFAKTVWLDLNGNPTVLPLTQTAAGSNVYTFSSTSFFPLDGLGWNAGKNPQTSADMAGNQHNFSFTSELHYVFTFHQSVADSATPTVFTFTGDDDVWAFINTFNVVDLGGMHDMEMGSIPLDTMNAAALGLVDGGFYSIDLFQAERHTLSSDYTITLGGFTHTVTTCETVCGDGIAAGKEQCDNGANNVPASSNPYGRGVCTDQCTLAPYCGDGIVQADHGEKCDGPQPCQSNCQPTEAM